MEKKLKIAHYNDAFFERSETFIYNYIANFKNVHPVLLARKFENFDLFLYPKSDCFTLPIEFPKKFTLSWFLQKIRQRIFGSHFTGEEIFCRGKNVRLIHAHFAPQGFWAINWFVKSSIPVITSFYGYDVSELPNDPVWARRLNILFEKGRLFLVEGQFMRSKLMQIGCPQDKIKIQRIAIPLEKLPYRERYPKRSQERTVFIFCGRFVEKKGLRYVLEALSQVKSHNKNFEFRVIGDGPLKEQVQEWTHGLNLSDHVTLLGFLNYEQYIIEMDKADIFIHPSVTSQTGDSEGGAPTVILEAQAMGMPVIATTHADIPNIVKPQESALLSSEKDVAGLVSNIMQVLQNQDRWAAMGRAGRAFVEEFHDIKKEVGALERIYSEAILTK